jgi:hypothetical protein
MMTTKKIGVLQPIPVATMENTEPVTIVNGNTSQYLQPFSAKYDLRDKTWNRTPMQQDQDGQSSVSKGEYYIETEDGLYATSSKNDSMEKIINATLRITRKVYVYGRNGDCSKIIICEVKNKDTIQTVKVKKNRFKDIFSEIRTQCPGIFLQVGKSKVAQEEYLTNVYRQSEKIPIEYEVKYMGWYGMV